MKIDIERRVFQPGLYLVATPIGNLGDITLRALEILQNADVIYCEDTRQTLKLLNAYSIKNKTAVYHDHSTEKIRNKILEDIKDNGKVIALVSDAGMPLISDPGYKLIQDAKEKDVYVTSLPGANAVLTAIQLSGLPSEPFVFLGFLPNKKQALQTELAKWKEIPATLVCYEAKQRVLKTLTQIKDIMGTRQVAVIRELTKKFEEIIQGPVDDVLNTLSSRENLKGEFVIVIAPFTAQKITQKMLEKEITEALSKNISVKTIAENLSEKSLWSKKEIYNLSLKLKNQ